MVAGIDAADSAAMPAVMPGMMRKEMPASASAMASSPPRPNMQGSPPLSRSTRLFCARQFDQPPGDIGLLRRRPAAALAGVFKLRLRARKRQHALADQRVVHDDVGLGQAGERVERQQAGIAGAGAGQPDMTGLQGRNAAEQGCEGFGFIHIYRDL